MISAIGFGNIIINYRRYFRRVSLTTLRIGDRHGRPGAINLDPFVGVALKSETDRLYSRYRADTDVK